MSERALRWWLGLFVVALAVPAGLLLYRAYSQLKWEVFHQYRVSAEELSLRVDTTVARLIDAEEARSFSDYSFLTAGGDPTAPSRKLSPLSRFPVAGDIPGLVGYFQVDGAGILSSPVVPDPAVHREDYGIGDEELRKREALSARLERILSAEAPATVAAEDNRADRPGTEPGSTARGAQVEAQAANGPESAGANLFDRLSKSIGAASRDHDTAAYGRVADLELDSRLEQKSRERDERAEMPAQVRQGAKRESRKEQIVLYEAAPAAVPERPGDTADRMIADHAPGRASSPAAAPQPKRHLRLFESEIGPFDIDRLGSDYFVLFRNVWRDGARFIQGAVIERTPFVNAVVLAAYRGTGLARMSTLLVAYEGDVIATTAGSARDYSSGAPDLRGELLYRTRLSAPLGGLEMIYTVVSLPLGSGIGYLAWVALALALVLVGGCLLMYRFGLGQIRLYRQQQDFVSAVSHELKTPLTSIRMYSEILKAGWAGEDKKSAYYDFIHDESERLSRLIGNVLQLSRMSRGNEPLALKRVNVADLLAQVRPKLEVLLDSAGFEFGADFEDAALAADVAVNADAFTQIMINLVDNAVKFAPPEALRRVDISCTRERGPNVRFAVRDFGRGIPRDQMRRIFELFYRPQSELTRETVGTGIGLALVQQLCGAMHGRIDVCNREPGAEFSVTFPVTV